MKESGKYSRRGRAKVPVSPEPQKQPPAASKRDRSYMKEREKSRRNDRI